MWLHLFRYHEYGTDGGPAVKVLEPKLDVFTKLIASKAGIQIPEIDVSISLSLSLIMLYIYP